MTRNKSLSSSLYTENANIDLHYYASTFSDKQRTAKLLEQQLVRSSLDECFLRIKRKPFPLLNDTRLEHYREASCRNCFTVDYESPSNNYYLNILDTSQLCFLRNPIKPGFTFLRWMVAENKCSVDVSHQVPKNERLLSVTEEKCKNAETETDRLTVQAGLSQACRKLAYNLSFLTLKIIGTLFHLFSSTLMKRLIVSSAEVDNLKEAQEQDVPILYLLRNPSRIDWFIVVLTLFFTNAKIPVVLGQGKEKPKLLRWVLRKCGVVFIQPPQHDISKNDVERKICDETLSVLIEEHLQAKNHLIMSLYTPSGDPDVRLLSVVIHSVSRQLTEDILVTPVIVGREKNAEDFLSRKWSEKNPCSKLVDLFRGKLNSGFVKVNFLKAFSMKCLIHAAAGRSKKLKEIQPEELPSLALKVISHVTYDFCRMRPVMATDLVSYLLLKKYRNGVRLSDITDEITIFVNRIAQDWKRVGFTGRPEAVVEHAVKILGPQSAQIENRNGEKFVVPILKITGVLQLAEHAHETMMHFMLEAIIFTSISMIFPDEFSSAFKTNTELNFSYQQLLTHAERLRDILQFEYTFEKFCVTFYDDFLNALIKLSHDDCVRKIEKLYTEEEEWARRYARHLEESEEDDPYYGGGESPSPTRNVRDDSDIYVLNFAGGRSIFKETVLYRNVLRPYLQAYAASAEHLNTLKDKQVPCEYYCRTLSDEIASRLSDNQTDYPETGSPNVLRNTLKLFMKWKVIECYRVNDIEFISLCDEFREANALQRIIDKVDVLK